MARRAAHASFPRLSGAVTIAGGGLAGLSLAAGLRLRGVPVQVREAGSYPRHRVCGEFISGVEERTLEALGIAGLFSEALPKSGAAWFREGRKVHADRLTEPALAISRYRLDTLLKDRVISLGAGLTERNRLAREPREGLVWAAGRIPGKSPWIGLKCHYSGLATLADLEMHMGRNGYAGLVEVESPGSEPGGSRSRVNVCGLFQVDRSICGSGPRLLENYLRAGGNAALADRLAEGEADASAFCAVAGFSLGRQRSDPRLCTLGDAESMIPPFTGNGMSMAFEAAELALDPLERWSRGSLAWDACLAEIRGGLHRRFRKRLAAAQAMHPFLLNAGGRDFIEAAGRAGILPFRPLLSLVR